MERKEVIKTIGMAGIGSILGKRSFAIPPSTKLQASWVHGNALIVESPDNLAQVGHFGWGADMFIKPGKSSWFHIPLLHLLL